MKIKIDTRLIDDNLCSLEKENEGNNIIFSTIHFHKEYKIIFTPSSKRDWFIVNKSDILCIRSDFDKDITSMSYGRVASGTAISSNNEIYISLLNENAIAISPTKAATEYVIFVDRFDLVEGE